MPAYWPSVFSQPQLQTGTGSVAIWDTWVENGTGSAYHPSIWDVWHQWQNRQTVFFQNTSQGTVWHGWQDDQPISVTQANPPVTVVWAPPPVPLPVPAPRDEMIARTRSRARMLRAKFAARRAEALLLEHLTAEQAEEWQRAHGFAVVTADGLRTYRIDRGLAGNVRLVALAGEPPVSKHGFALRVGSRFCMHVYHPDGAVPVEDNVLAQKLLLEANEAHFLELANVS